MPRTAQTLHHSSLAFTLLISPLIEDGTIWDAKRRLLSHFFVSLPVATNDADESKTIACCYRLLYLFICLNAHSSWASQILGKTGKTNLPYVKVLHAKCILSFPEWFPGKSVLIRCPVFSGRGNESGSSRTRVILKGLFRDLMSHVIISDAVGAAC